MQSKLLTLTGIGLLSVLITLPVLAKAVDGDRQAQRDERRAEMLERFDADGNGPLSQEERQSFRKEHIAKQLESMSPEERDNFQARLEEKKDMREQMKGMSKEEKKAFRKEHLAEKLESMSPEEKKKFKARAEKRRLMRMALRQGRSDSFSE